MCKTRILSNTIHKTQRSNCNVGYNKTLGGKHAALYHKQQTFPHLIGLRPNPIEK